MKLDVKFQYTQKFLPTKRHRKCRTRAMESICNVQIQEPTTEDFPVAFIVTDMATVYPAAKDYRDIQSREDDTYIALDTEYRVYRDDLYKPVRVSCGAAVSTLYEEANWIVSRLKQECRPTYYAADLFDLFTDQSIPVTDDKKDREQMIHAASEKYLWYDNKVWIRTQEPRYVVMTFGLGRNHGGTAMFIEHYYNPNISKECYFSALQRDEAIAYGKRTALQRGDDMYVDQIGAKINIKVLMPKMVKVSPNE